MIAWSEYLLVRYFELSHPVEVLLWQHIKLRTTDSDTTDSNSDSNSEHMHITSRKCGTSHLSGSSGCQTLLNCSKGNTSDSGTRPQLLRVMKRPPPAIVSWGTDSCSFPAVFFSCLRSFFVVDGASVAFWTFCSMPSGTASMTRSRCL